MEQDLDCVAGLIGLQTIASVEEHEGSRQLFLFEQLTHLDRSAGVPLSSSHACHDSFTAVVMLAGPSLA